MQRLKQVKSESMFPIIKELLDDGKSARITVTGMSMYPFLRENIDSVELTNVDTSKLQKGDIVMVRKDSNEYVMHRIIRIEKDYFYMVGDAQKYIEGPLRYNQVFAKVTAVWRMDNKIDTLNLYWRLLSNIWMILLPFRFTIINIHKKLRI